MKVLREISRYLVAAVFLFSGFVKGVDPLGTAYRLEDYFIAYGTSWADPLALFLSIALSTAEFVIGASLLLNIRMKFMSWALLIMMLFFTFLTLFDAVYEPVSDCGCFGDAIKMTNWQTFYKNIVLLVFTLIVFRGRKLFRSGMKPASQMIVLLMVLSGFVWFSVYNFRHLPMIDFMDWKIGRDMTPDQNQTETLVYLTFKNKETGQTNEYLSPNYPWNDSVWMTQWDFVDQRIVVLGESIQHGLYAEDDNGNDVTLMLIDNSDLVFVVVSYDFSLVSSKAIRALELLSKELNLRNIDMALLTSSLPEEVTGLLDDYNLSLDVYYADEVVLKTMVRANPGLIAFREGVVHGKWHYHDFPHAHKLDKLLEVVNNQNQTE
jgi:uncharacterized membrane protein YphA (DoxX/SURF4 family)